MYKSIWVKAHFLKKGKWVTKKKEDGYRTEMVEKGFLKKRQVEKRIPIYKDVKEWIVTSISDSEIDGEKLTIDINNAIELLHNDGYEVMNVTPVISGRYKYDYADPIIRSSNKLGYGWGYGFSYTEGVNIIAKKTN